MTHPHPPTVLKNGVKISLIKSFGAAEHWVGDQIPTKASHSWHLLIKWHIYMTLSKLLPHFGKMYVQSVPVYSTNHFWPIPQPATRGRCVFGDLFPENERINIVDQKSSKRDLHLIYCQTGLFPLSCKTWMDVFFHVLPTGITLLMLLY